MRLEFVGGKLLYAMRVVTHGQFNLCPSEVCNPGGDDGGGGGIGACSSPQRVVVHAKRPRITADREGSDGSSPRSVPFFVHAVAPQSKANQKPVEFFPLPLAEVPSQALRDAKRIVRSVGMDVAGIEYVREGGAVWSDVVHTTHATCFATRVLLICSIACVCVVAMSVARASDFLPHAPNDRCRRQHIRGRYLETPDGRRVFYDINANSNLRRPVAKAWGGFDPFERVADFLAGQVATANDTVRPPH